MLPLKIGTVEPSKVGAPIVPQTRNGCSFIKISVFGFLLIWQEKLTVPETGIVEKSDVKKRGDQRSRRFTNS